MRLSALTFISGIDAEAKLELIKVESEVEKFIIDFPFPNEDFETRLSELEESFTDAGLVKVYELIKKLGGNYKQAESKQEKPKEHKENQTDFPEKKGEIELNKTEKALIEFSKWEVGSNYEISDIIEELKTGLAKNAFLSENVDWNELREPWIIIKQKLTGYFIMIKTHERTIEMYDEMKDELNRVKEIIGILNENITEDESDEEEEENKYKILFSSLKYTIEIWIGRWKSMPNAIAYLIPNCDELFPYLEKYREYYDGEYTYIDLEKIFEKFKDKIIEVAESEENYPQKLKNKIKSLKKQKEKYLPDKEGFTSKYKADKEKELTQEIDRLERKLEKIKQIQKTKIPRSIDNWYKDFQITKPQLDKLHKLVELEIITIDFVNTLYTWKEVEEMLKKSLPLKKQTIYQWWLKKEISDEDYFLLKKAGVNTDNEELTQKEVWELVDKHGIEPSTPKIEEKQTFKGWYNERIISKKEYELLVNNNVDPNKEFTSLEIGDKIKEISEKPTPKPQKKQTIYKWFMEGKIVDEDYIMLKKAGVNTEEEMTLSEINDLIIKHDTEGN